MQTKVKNLSLFNDIFKSEFQLFITRYPQLKVIEQSLNEALNSSVVSLETNKKIMTCGNGGSCADAEHIVGELLKGFLKKRHYNDLEHSEMFKVSSTGTSPDYAADFKNQLQKPLRALSLMGHPSFQTAFLNDKNPEFIIAQHMLALGDAGDTVIAISTSGNSKNILRTVQLAKVLGIKSILLTGQDGGSISRIADHAIKVPSNKVHEIQEYHLPIYHFYCYFIEKYFFSEDV